MADSSATSLATVVISTRNRGDSVTRVIRGLLCNTYSNFELIVIDQSEDNRTEAAVKPYLEDSRVHYMRSATKGISAGRNVGISRARGAWIAMTDDDCEVPDNWLQQFAAVFSIDRNIGIVFGNALWSRMTRPQVLPSHA